VTGTGNLLPYCIVAGSMSLGYGSIYTLLADLRDRYGFSEAQLGLIVAAGVFAGFGTQLALARLADRADRAAARPRRHPARDGRDDRERGRHPVLGLGRRLLLGREWRGGPAIRRIDHSGTRRGRRQPGSWPPPDVAGFMLGPLVAGSSPRRSASALRVPRRGLRRRSCCAPPRSHRRVGGIRSRHPAARLLVRPAIQATLAACVALPSPSACSEDLGRTAARPRRETWLIGLTLSLTRPMIFLAPIEAGKPRRYPLRVVSVSLTIATICTFSYGVLPSLWMLLAVSLVHAVADSFTMPSNQVAAALGSPPEHLSAAQGLLGATGLAAAGLTGLVAGFVYEEAGRVAVCTGTALVMTVFLDRDHARAVTSPTPRRWSAPMRRRRPRPSATGCPTAVSADGGQRGVDRPRQPGDPAGQRHVQVRARSSVSVACVGAERGTGRPTSGVTCSGAHWHSGTATRAASPRMVQRRRQRRRARTVFVQLDPRRRLPRAVAKRVDDELVRRGSRRPTMAPHAHGQARREPAAADRGRR
jgi:MFS family permease